MQSGGYFMELKREMRVSNFGGHQKRPILSFTCILCDVVTCFERICGEISFVPRRTIMNLSNRLFLFNLCANINMCVVTEYISFEHNFWYYIL